MSTCPAENRLTVGIVTIMNSVVSALRKRSLTLVILSLSCSSLSDYGKNMPSVSPCIGWMPENKCIAYSVLLLR